MSARRVDCGEHGMRAPAFICGHALRAAEARTPRPFYWTDAEADEPCGWCEDCHRRYLAEGEEWIGAAEANLDLQVICVDCFREIIRLNGYA